MKKFVVLLMTIAFVATAGAEPLDFDFDGFGGPYRSKDLVDQLNARFDFYFESITLVVIETPSLNDEEYKEQVKILDSMDNAQPGKIMYVTVCTSEVPKEGYRTDVETAKELAGGKASFRVRLLDGSGEVYHSAKKPVTADKLLQLMKSAKKTAK